MKKRLLSVLLVLSMVISFMPAMSITASAETVTPYLTFSSQSEFKLGTDGDNCNNWIKNTDSYLQYTTTPENEESWTVWDGTAAISSAEAGGTYYLYLRGKMTTGSMSWFDEGDPTDLEDDGWCETNFDFRDAAGDTIGDGETPVPETKRVNCTGNIMTLLDYEHPDTVEMSTYAFLYLFYECYALGTAPTLPATTLADGCYDDMFCECTSLEKAPTLPATTLNNGCYAYMFDGCTLLTEAPKLPATELKTYCYDEMFKGCSSLTEAPELSATTLAKGCYWGMFQNSGLTKTPELPVTELAEECYQSMFYGCESLTEAPKLPATVMKDYCYGDMFSGCTSLKVAPKLPSTTLAESCYASMFDNCTSLVYAPDLPATELKANCYAGMFRGCTALTTPPYIATATDLVSRGSEPYQYMFKDCSSLVKYTSSAEGRVAFFTVPGELDSENSHFFNNYCQDMFGDGDNYDKYTVFYVGTVAAPIYEAPVGNTSLVFNGNEQALLSSEGKVETPACKLQYSLTEDGTYTDSVPTASAVSTYTVWYKAVSNGSALYYDSEPKSVTAQIAEAVCQITACEANPTIVGKYSSIADALSAASNNAATIQLIANVTEDVNIESGKNITLDLNGYVLKSTGSGSVITNNGTLYIIDSDTTAQTHKVRYFTDEKCVHGVAIDTHCEVCDQDAAPDGCYETYYDTNNGLTEGTYLTVTGGCITGGTGTQPGEDPQFYGGGIYNNGTLYLQGGNIVGNTVWTIETSHGGGVYVCEGKTFTMTAGSIIGNSASGGGGVYVSVYDESLGVFNLEGGSISANLASDGGTGGGGVNNRGKLNITGGTISANRTNFMGGGINNNGEMNMSDGVVSGNEAIYAGGIYADESITITGGTISGNTVVENGFGSGVLCYGDEDCILITLGGDVIISGNTAGCDTSNLALKSATINIASDENAPDDMSVGVSLLNDELTPIGGVFTTNGKNSDRQYFFSDNDEYFVKYVNGNTSLQETDPLYSDHLELAVATVKIDKEIENGKIEVNNQEAQAGAEVTVTATPDNGYELDTITVTDKNGNSIKLNDDNTFVMPTEDTDIPVIVNATFKEKKNLCIYSAPLTTGDNMLLLGGREAGEFSISGEKCKGFTLKNSDGEYLALVNDEVKFQTEKFTWKYDGGLYAETKTTCKTGYWFWSKTTKSKKYYLNVDDSDSFYGPSEIKDTQALYGTGLLNDVCRFSLSTTRVCAEIQVTADRHTFKYLHNGDGYHEAVCTKCGYEEGKVAHIYDEITDMCVCGKIDPKVCCVSDVDVIENQVKKTAGFLFWKKTVITYQYVICPETQSVGVCKVEYSGNSENWNTGDVFTSDVQLSKFYIRVTDSNGKITNWLYNDNVVYPGNSIE